MKRTAVDKIYAMGSGVCEATAGVADRFNSYPFGESVRQIIGMYSILCRKIKNHFLLPFCSNT